MTLLLGTISKTNIVITAEGLSPANPTTGAGIQSNNFQKISPVPMLTLSMAHHGYNILNNQPVGDFLRPFIGKSNANFRALNIQDVATELLKFAEPAAQNIFGNPANKEVIGFWVTGFSTSKERPCPYEICRPNKTRPTLHKPVVFAGCGRQFVDYHTEEFRTDKSKCGNVQQFSGEDAISYHSELYEEAKTKQMQSGKTVFGGHRHQLVIEKDYWRWIQPPQDV